MRLLDIGCAYGPFLAAAREQGFDVMGIDPAPDAVEYVQKTLGIRAIRGIFPRQTADLEDLRGRYLLPPESAEPSGAEPGEDPGIGPFDVITLWFVIEHFEEPGRALEEINGLLKTGGVLAFSTPSAAGISRRKQLSAFLKQSPADHWTIWDPRGAAKILDRYGFRLKKRVITGHHPERFPGMSRAPAAVLRLCLSLSRIFGLGDTFEAYAVKVRDCTRGNHG
jgi:2-polyprenyl-3-methyl-5-hydroxy-6-metoxy-1,4-benzoquinol methylase